jgi:hypothetical protein
MKRDTPSYGYIVIRFKDTLTQSFLWGRRCEELAWRIGDTLQQLFTSPLAARAFREQELPLIGERGETVGIARWEKQPPPSDPETHVTLWVGMDFEAPEAERTAVGQTLQPVLRRVRWESAFDITDAAGERIGAYDDALARDWEAAKSVSAQMESPNEQEAQAQRLREDVAKARWRGEVTPNGIAFTSEPGNMDGYRFQLLRQSHHTDQDIQLAKKQLRDGRDVIGVSVVPVPVPDPDAPGAPADGPEP